MKYPVLLESCCTPGLVVYMTSNYHGVVVKGNNTFGLGYSSNNWSSSDGDSGYSWKEYEGDITITLKGKRPLVEWLQKNRVILNNHFCANNEYHFGKDDKKYFEVFDFTCEPGGTYVLFCEDYEISNVTKEQIINFAKTFGLELSDD